MRMLTDIHGLRVRLTEERMNHILEHPEMREMEASIDRTLVEPDLIVESKMDEGIRLYYRFLPQTMVGPKFMAVIVKVRPDDAFVVTAYLTDKAKSGRLLWSRER